MANRFFVAGGVDNNWGTSGNWSTTSGGGGGAAVPTSSDDVFFDGNSPNCTINASARVGLSIDFTGYTNTITFSQPLTITNNVTLAAGMAFAGSAALTVNSTCTFTSNGKSVDVPLTFGTGTNSTTTLADDLTTTALMTCITSKVFNGNTFNIGAGFAHTGAAATTISGTTLLKFTGTGAWTQVGNTSQVANNVTFEAGANTITISGIVKWAGDTGRALTYVSGTMVVTGSTLTISGFGNNSIAIGGVTWNNVSIVGASTTTTLDEDLNVSGAFELAPSGGVTRTLNGGTINAAGNVSFTTAATTVTGTTVLKFTGTGTWVGASAQTFQLPVTFDTTGTITVDGTVRYSNATMTYVAGTFAQVNTGTIHISSHTTTILDFDGGTLGPVILQVGAGGVTLNLASELVIDSTGGIIFLGTSSASRATVKTISGGVQQKLTVEDGALIDVRFTNATDIDSSSGRDIPYGIGTITNTLNWVDTTNIGRKEKPKGGSGKNVSYALCAQSHAIGNPGITVG